MEGERCKERKTVRNRLGNGYSLKTALKVFAACTCTKQPDLFHTHQGVAHEEKTRASVTF